MAEGSSTCWTTVRGAARGDARERDAFARNYLPVARAYLEARWRGTALSQEVDDAIQEAFVDCFDERGALSRADTKRSFRGFFLGVLRIVALRVEERGGRGSRTGRASTTFDVPDEEPALSEAFDRAWASSILRQAAMRHEERAAEEGEDARRRLRLLRLRFQDDLPIREIARRWQIPAERLHRDYARARREFRSALMEVVGDHHPGSAAAVEAECGRLLDFFV